MKKKKIHLFIVFMVSVSLLLIGALPSISLADIKGGYESTTSITIIEKEVGIAMEKYQAVSEIIYRILYRFTPTIEVVSIDEAFLDISGSQHLFGGARQSCLLLKQTIANIRVTYC